MKKNVLILLLLFCTVAVFAQTPLKVHGDGRISLQSASTSYGIQIPASGVAFFEPNLTYAYDQIVAAKTRNLLAKAWVVKNASNTSLPVPDVFYVLGNGDVFTYGDFLSYSPPGNEVKGYFPIEGATELILGINGYYYDSQSFEGITLEELLESENIKPEALEGILTDFEKSKALGLKADELETIIPEAVRHDAVGAVYVNYTALIPVFVEAFKEQQARIEQLETILEENGLLNPKR